MFKKSVLISISLVVCLFVLPSITPGQGKTTSISLGQTPILQWSTSGPIAGMKCTQINEPADPHTWDDNYLCSNVDLKLRWSFAGRINNANCVQINEPSDPNTWDDNFLCQEKNTAYPVKFQWSYAGKINGLKCLPLDEAAEPVQHAWTDNFLCYEWQKTEQELKSVNISFVNKTAYPVEIFWVNNDAGTLYNQLNALERYDQQTFQTHKWSIRYNRKVIAEYIATDNDNQIVNIEAVTWQAGPIWNQADAEAKCSRAAIRGLWTGGWWTTEAGKMSVCEILRIVPTFKIYNISGRWRGFFSNGAAAKNTGTITQNGTAITIDNGDGGRASFSNGFIEGNKITATDWRITGTLSADGKKISWSNNTSWVKLPDSASSSGETNDKTIKEILLPMVVGTYQRNPVENDWHTGRITKDGDNLRWTNKAGVSWKLIPDILNQRLRTDAENPYYNDGAREFKMIVVGDRITGFEFNGEIYYRQNP